jgi:hypothetical protein
MRCWHRCIAIVLVALPLAACGVAAGAAPLSAPTVLPPVVAPPATPAAESISSAPPEDCPVTQAPEPAFTPPAPYPPTPPGDYAWYGTNRLWTALPQDGVWSALPKSDDGYGQKVLWWREGYSWRDEPEPALTVSGRRLDAAGDTLYVSRATNAYAEDIQSAMLVGVDIPSLGCWQISGRYAGTELSFVVWVAP